tara:strand:+ start:1185 stop:1475 length:291 start_codon:yes stop_codon:yes gene_type:complete
MAYLDIEAIKKAYPDATFIDEDRGAFKADGSQITLVQSDIDAARTTLNTEAAAIAYQGQRKAEYPSIEDQLDTIYHSGVAGWKTTIKAIKDKYPKP